MCLISNKYKFIFIKTCRVSGTETEAFLKQFSDECYTNSLLNVKNGLYEHSTALQIKEYLIKNNRQKDWDNYLKITIIRNPYAMILSSFGWCQIRNVLINKNIDFNEWLSINMLKNIKLLLFDKLYIDNELIIDKFIYKENKEQTLNEILHILGINKKYKSDEQQIIASRVSRFNSDDYHKFYNQKSIDLVSNDLELSKFMNEFNYKY
jgi:hypothetical protein